MRGQLPHDRRPGSRSLILEGTDGMFAACGSGPTAATVFAESLSAGHLILDVRHKPFAGCNFIQTPIAAALAVRAKLPGASADL
jgi:2-methylcitrate dehydratase PrpD